MSKDYYKTLGVDKKASKDEIKKAFHKLAHQHHPDKNNGDDTKFKEVNEAYQVLSDDKKRASYDQFGSADGAQGFGGFGGQGGGFGGFDFSQGGVEFDMGNLGDIFGDFFGGGMGGRNSRQRKGRDVQTEITLTFEEAIFGVSKVIKINKQTVCNICNGSGAKAGTNLKTCPTCDGQGQVREIKRSILGNFETRKMCETCFGKGKVPNEKCSQCKGSGIYRKDENITLNIPSGINNGETLRVHGMGEAIQNGITGDLYVKLNVKPHHIYTRENSNLLTNIDIKLTDALLGTTYDLEILEGKTVEVKIPEGINNGDLLRVKGKGVPTGHSRGDIIIKVHLKMPTKLSRNNKELIEKLKEEGL